jgi:hypothetical protein
MGLIWSFIGCLLPYSTWIHLVDDFVHLQMRFKKACMHASPFFIPLPRVGWIVHGWLATSFAQWGRTGCVWGGGYPTPWSVANLPPPKCLWLLISAPNKKVVGLNLVTLVICNIISLEFTKLRFLWIRKTIWRSHNQFHQVLKLISSCYELSKSIDTET